MEQAVSHLEACRICANFFLSTEMEFVSLFESKDNELLDFIQNELRAWQLEISANDGLPQRICGNCFNRFCSIQAFRRECEQAQHNFCQALLPQCNASAEELVQLQLLPEQLNLMAANDAYLPGEVPVEVAEVVVGLEAAQEVELTSMQQEHANFGVYQEKFPDLSSATLVDTSSNVQLVDNGFMNVTDDDMLALMPTVATNSLQLSPAMSGMVHATEANSILSAQSITAEIEDIASQDLEEMLQGSIIPTNPNKNKDKLNSGFSKQTEPQQSHNPSKSTGSTGDAVVYLDNESMEPYDPDTTNTRVSGNPLACQYCFCPVIGNVNNLIFPDSDALSQHFFDAHDPNLPYTCPQCSLTYNTARQRDIHVRDVHKKPLGPNERCPYCLKKLRVSQAMHEYSCTFVSDWECSQCNQKFPQAALHRFRAHERSHDPSKQWRCNVCDRFFLKRSDLKEHKHTHTLQPDSLVECDVCLSAFSTEYEMKRHQYLSHNGPLPVYCEHCGKGFVSIAFLSRHIQHFHPQKGSEEHSSDAVSCRNCNTNFGSLHKLRYHQQRQRDENGKCLNEVIQKEQRRRQQRQGLFPCAHCPKRFHLKTQLQKHLNTHDERLRPKQCDMCHIRCRTTFELQQHVNVAHLNVKSFECHKCGKRFGYNTDLRNHMLSHSELDIQCKEEGCDYVCNNDKTLNDHIRHKHRFHACEYCGDSFTRQKLTLHLRSMHRSEIDVEFQPGYENSTTDKVRVELVNSEPSIPSLALQDQLPNTFVASTSNIDGYFLGSLLDPDNEIIVT